MTPSSRLLALVGGRKVRDAVDEMRGGTKKMHFIKSRIKTPCWLPIPAFRNVRLCGFPRAALALFNIIQLLGPNLALSICSTRVGVKGFARILLTMAARRHCLGKKGRLVSLYDKAQSCFSRGYE